MANLDLSKLAELTKKGAPKTRTVTHDISIRKPGATEWFTIRPGDEWTADIPIHSPASIGKQRPDNPFIVYDEETIQILGAKNAVRFCSVYVVQNRDETTIYLSVIPLFRPTHDFQSENKFNSSRRDCYEIAKNGFVQMANTGEQYATTLPVAAFAPPVWPTNLPDLKSCLDIAFDKHVIDSKDHPVIRRMEGKE